MLRTFSAQFEDDTRATFHLLMGDITRLTVDAVVNAANPTLLGGGGVDGAIHRAAGPKLLAACRLLGGCATGEAKATPAFGLSAKWIFHTVGPRWSGGAKSEAEQLASCYLSCLRLAAQHHATSIAFPCISTGVYGYPVQQACSVAVQACVDFLRQEVNRPEIYFVCFGRPDWEIYHSALQSL
jgi:O-acetyl-ADP-ribose deacetylase